VDRLRAALTANRTEIEAALAEAETELGVHESRAQLLRGDIARARIALGLDEPEAGDPGTRTASRLDSIRTRTYLHEAMQLILAEHPEGLRPVDLTDQIRRRGLYARRDGRPAEVGQVHARVHNYPGLFVRDQGRILLRGSEDTAASRARHPNPAS
jgi:hypothetical protein